MPPPKSSYETSVESVQFAAKQARIWKNLLASYLTKHYLNLLTLALLLASVFFYSQIQAVRNKALSNKPELFSQGDIVQITNVIDGDELQIENNSGRTRVRLLGIKSFDATANDRTVSEFGRVCVDYLTNNYVGVQAVLEISPKGVDNEGRLLATLYIDGQEMDVCEDLINKGLTLVYVRYPFEKMEQYLLAQAQAEKEQQGLWLNPRIAARSRALLQSWEAERDAEDEKQSAAGKRNDTQENMP